MSVTAKDLNNGIKDINEDQWVQPKDFVPIKCF